MHSRIYMFLLTLVLCLIGCTQENNENTSVAKGELIAKSDTTQKDVKPDYQHLQQLIIYGRANLHQVRQALTDSDPASLTNTVHAIFAMRWHRGVLHLLDGTWKLDKQKYPELAWEHLAWMYIPIESDF